MDVHGIEKLRGSENWNLWKFTIRNVLRGTENAYEVCTNILPRPVQPAEGATADVRKQFDVDFSKWDKADRAASQILVRSLESNVTALLVACASARDMWVKLHAVFEQQTKQAAHVVQTKFFSFQKHPEDDMVSHIARYEGLVLQMQNLNVKPDDSSLMVKLLDTLPEEYEGLRQAWWARPEEQQTLSNLVSVLTSDEGRRKQHAEDRDQITAFMAAACKKRDKAEGSGSFQKKKEQNRKKNPGNKKKFKCYNCGEVGHLKRDCPNPKQSSKSEATDSGKVRVAFIAEAQNAEVRTDLGLQQTWVVDSGATDHMTHNRNWFTSFQMFTDPIDVRTGNNATMKAVGQGTIDFDAEVDGKWLPCTMRDVLFVPDSRKNYFSVTAANDRGFDFKSSKTSCEFLLNGEVVARGVRRGRLLIFLIRINKPLAQINEMSSGSKQSLQVWHEKLGHQNKRHCEQFLRKNGIPFISDDSFCGACVEGKQTRSTFLSRNQRATEPGAVIHADLCGPMESPSLGGAKYFLCFTCDFSRFRFVYFLKEKSETHLKIAEMLQLFSTHYGKKVQSLQTDGGLEFNNEKVKNILKTQGNKLVIVNPYSPEQNDCAERTNRTVVDLARTMLLSKGLPKYLWAEAVNTSVYVLNHTGPSGIQQQTPFELLSGKKSHVSKLQIFGAECYVHVPDQKRRKWDPKGQPGIFVGYTDGIDGYRVWLKSENKIILSKHVTFKPDKGGKVLTLFETQQNGNLEEHSRERDELLQQEDQESAYDTAVEISDDSNDKDIELPPQPTGDHVLRDRSTIKPPSRLIEADLLEVDEPRNYTDAVNSPQHEEWKAAMEEEMRSLEETSTWSLVDLPPGRKAVSNRWVYKVKRGADGEIDRFKARLVAKGYSQKQGVDYNETFSPVARFDTIRTVLSVAANEKLELKQFDVKSAFLNGVLQEEIFMEQPEGFQDSTRKVCKLNKSLYGLKQSPRCWNERFKDVLFRFGLRESEADSCLFYRVTSADKLIVVIYVDDGLVAATKKSTADEFLKELKATFQITSGDVGYFLNMLIEVRDDGSVFIGQQKYAEDVLRRFKMEDCNKVSTPIEGYIQPGEAEAAESTLVPYREAVGCLMYLAVVTRPDLAFAVSYASQFLDKPKERHWKLIKRILKYLRGTASMGILYRPAVKTGEVEVFSDADFAGEPSTRRSVSGMVSMYSGGAITWMSRRQQCVSLSTTEAEYIAVSEAGKEAVWLNRLLGGITSLNSVPTLMCDNASAIKLAMNGEFHKRSKHIDVRHHYVRDLLKAGQVSMKFIPSKNQIADICTKPVTRATFVILCKLLGMEVA